MNFAAVSVDVSNFPVVVWWWLTYPTPTATDWAALTAFLAEIWKSFLTGQDIG
jgi:hypothetical protein